MKTTSKPQPKLNEEDIKNENDLKIKNDFKMKTTSQYIAKHLEIKPKPSLKHVLIYGY